MSVAATLFAATLSGFGCIDLDEAAESASASANLSENPLAVLETRWVIAADPAREPPLAAPVAIAAEEGRDRLLVLETHPPELRVYDAVDGTFLAALGREGDGPGEYRHPLAVAVDRAGRSAVLSVGGRVTHWDAAGAFVASLQLGAGIATDVMAARGDTFYVKLDLFPPDDVSRFRVVTPDTVLERVLYSDDGVPGTEEPGRRFRNHAYAVTATRQGDLLLSPPGPHYIILRIGPEGSVRQTIRRPDVLPLVRSDEEVEAVRTRVRKGLASAGRPAPAQLHVPRHRSHVARLAAGPEGSIWAVTRRGDDQITIIDRFGADGSFRESYRVNLQVADLAVTSKAIFLLARGELDVAGVAVARWPGADAPSGGS